MSGFWPAQLMRLVSGITTLSRDFAEAEGVEPPTFGFGDRHSTNWTFHRWGGGTRTHEAGWRQIYSLLLLPLKNTSISWWNLVESNHVLRIFCPTHTPSLPKFQFMRKQKDSNLRSLVTRHVSSVQVSTVHLYFCWILGAKVQYPYAVFLRNQ